MFRLVLCALIVSATAVSGATRQAKPWVNVETGKGEVILGFLPRTEPYAPGVPHAIAEYFTTPDVVDKSGRVISALKFYGWSVGATTNVVVLADVPVEGAQNQNYPKGSPQLKTVELSRHALDAGAVQQVQELGKSLTRSLRLTMR
jgi:hypothetical protein